MRHSAKVLPFDATGEFEPLQSDAVRHVHIGNDSTGQESSDELVLPFYRADGISPLCAVQTERPDSGAQDTGGDQEP
jgi:hypothetical protein